LVGTAQPLDQAVFEGLTAQFKVGMATNALLNFHWRRDGGTGPTNLTDIGNVSGAATGILRITDVSPSDPAPCTRNQTKILIAINSKVQTGVRTVSFSSR